MNTQQLDEANKLDSQIRQLSDDYKDAKLILSMPSRRHAFHIHTDCINAEEYLKKLQVKIDDLKNQFKEL